MGQWGSIVCCAFVTINPSFDSSPWIWSIPLRVLVVRTKHDPWGEVKLGIIFYPSIDRRPRDVDVRHQVPASFRSMSIYLEASLGQSTASIFISLLFAKTHSRPILTLSWLLFQPLKHPVALFAWLYIEPRKAVPVSDRARKTNV